MNHFCFRNSKRLQDVLNLPSEAEISQIETLQKFISPDLCYNIQFTSGTTGKPKAARLSHFSLVNCGYDMGELLCLLRCQQLKTHASLFFIRKTAGVEHQLRPHLR
jgi:long-subunit acyl-CoA synthetase (AMP-forming)